MEMVNIGRRYMVILVNLYTLGLLIQKKNKSSTLFILLTVRIIRLKRQLPVCACRCIHMWETNINVSFTSAPNVDEKQNGDSWWCSG